MNAKNKEVNMELIESHFQFKAPILESIEFVVNSSFNVENFEGFDSVDSNLEVQKENDYAKVVMFLEIGKKNEFYPFYIKIIMSAEFQWSESTEEQIEGYLNMNAPALLLSYMRPIVANITNSSKYEALNLPFINFAEIFELQKSNGES